MTDPGMKGSGRDRIRSLYEQLLGFYPSEFRRRYAADLMQAFDDRRTEARFTGTLGGLRLLVFLLRDFATSVWLASRMTPTLAGRGPLSRPLSPTTSRSTGMRRH